ncbi:Peroxin-3 [Penicillium macrosclerotiorum]|uniref:Peroxin-3 n=1 Tax=Penicillium macrosclerotiorum TaxID=303699 RepID=UPI0025494A73|nr:Peroxin-3 [Penicillium macrosclerotiorum]KAJ5689544.1 Peroxin-3 [Penicillium macrosclerotiorum]
MIGAARRWLRRNRKGLAIGAGVLGAGYLAGQYVLSKISEARERMSSDRIARENLRRRFEQNQTDCTYTVLALLPTATENILEALPVEELTKELQKKRAERLARLNAGEVAGSDMTSVSPSVTEDDRKSLSSFQSEGYLHASQLGDSINPDGQTQVKRNKTQLWNEVKITSITRSFTLIYTLSLLTLFTRIQLNLLGRRNYLSSVISLATPPTDSTISLEDHDDELTQTLGDDFETNRRYLAFSWWLLHRGWKELMERVQPAVEEVFGPLNPREDISLSKLSELTLQIRKKVEGSTEEERRSKKWLSCLLPPSKEEEYVLRESGVEGVADPSSSQTASKLRHLLDETADLIDSPSFSFVLTLLNNEGFSTLVDQKCANEAFKAPVAAPETVPQSFDSMATVVPAASEHKTKLANLLAVLARQAHVIGNGIHPPNEYLVAMDQNVRELEAFSAVIYSSNFDLELLGAKNAAAAAGNVGEESAGLDSTSSSFAAVMVDKEEEITPTADITQSVPVLVDCEPQALVSEPTTTAAEDQTLEKNSQEEAADSAFERAWGKAVEDGQTSTEPESQASAQA